LTLHFLQNLSKISAGRPDHKIDGYGIKRGSYAQPNVFLDRARRTPPDAYRLGLCSIGGCWLSRHYRIDVDGTFSCFVVTLDALGPHIMKNLTFVPPFMV
jgi:hypothetical protein